MDWLAALYGAGLVQAAWLLLSMSMLSVRNSVARWLLVTLIGILTLLLLEEFFDAIGHSLELGIGLAAEFAIGPLLYLFMRELAEPGGFKNRRLLIHCIPLAVGILLLVWLNIGFASESVSLSTDDMRGAVTAIVMVKIVVFFTYAAITLRIPVPIDAAASRRDLLGRLRLLIGLMVVVVGAQAALFLAFASGLSWAPDSDTIGGVFTAIAIYAIAHFAFVKRQVFDLHEPYGSSRLSPAEATEIRNRAEAHLAATQAFRDCEFDLRALARGLNMPPSRLSQALNAGGSDGFAGLLNRTRIDAYKVATEDPGNRDRTVLDLAFEAGFNSKATFYRALNAQRKSTASA